MPVNPDAVALMVATNKALGSGAVMVASTMAVPRRYTSGSITLDVALGGGYPANQWVEILGYESHGKTALVYKAIAANQALDPDFTTLWVAAEHYDVAWAQKLGVDNGRVIIHATQSMEDAYATMLRFAASRSVDCIVLDSYPALLADEEAAKDMDESVVAIGARLTGKFFRKAGAASLRDLTDPNDRPFLGLFINQYRDAIGQFSPNGTPETSPGGKAKNYAFYVRLKVKRDAVIKEKRPGKGEVTVGQTIKVTTVKNKSAAPQQVASVDFYYRDAPYLGFAMGEFDTVKEIVTMGILLDVISRGGAYFSIGETRWMGRAAMEADIRAEPALAEKLRLRIMDAAAHVDERSITEEDLDTATTDGKRSVSRKKVAA